MFYKWKAEAEKCVLGEEYHGRGEKRAGKGSRHALSGSLSLLSVMTACVSVAVMVEESFVLLTLIHAGGVDIFFNTLIRLCAIII